MYIESPFTSVILSDNEGLAYTSMVLSTDQSPNLRVAPDVLTFHRITVPSVYDLVDTAQLLFSFLSVFVFTIVYFDVLSPIVRCNSASTSLELSSLLWTQYK